VDLALFRTGVMSATVAKDGKWAFRERREAMTVLDGYVGSGRLPVVAADRPLEPEHLHLEAEALLGCILAERGAIGLQVSEPQLQPVQFLTRALDCWHSGLNSVTGGETVQRPLAFRKEAGAPQGLRSSGRAVAEKFGPAREINTSSAVSFAGSVLWTAHYG
jgi:hypothetical protein